MTDGIADGLDDGRIGVIGMVHHCMVDGLAALELAALLLDPTPEPTKAGPDGWQAARTPHSASLLLDGVVDRFRQESSRPAVDRIGPASAAAVWAARQGPADRSRGYPLARAGDVGDRLERA